MCTMAWPMEKMRHFQLEIFATTGEEADFLLVHPLLTFLSCSTCFEAEVNCTNINCTSEISHKNILCLETIARIVLVFGGESEQ